MKSFIIAIVIVRVSVVLQLPSIYEIITEVLKS